MDERLLDWQLSVGAFDVGDHGRRLAAKARSFVIQDSGRSPAASHAKLMRKTSQIFVSLTF